MAQFDLYDTTPVMTPAAISLLKLYIPLIVWVGLGAVAGQKLPKSVPFHLGKGLFWVGVPISIVTFLRQADLTGSVWIAPLMAWAAVALGVGLAWVWLRQLAQNKQPSLGGSPPEMPPATQGSFLLATMVGNTGYLGYPVTLALVGPKYFAWAVFYDTLGSTVAAYGLGVAIASVYGKTGQPWWRLVRQTLTNPGLLSFGVGLAVRPIVLPAQVEQMLRVAAWGVIALSLLLLGMRLGQLTSWRSIRLASIGLGIKMLVVPLVLGFVLLPFNLPAAAQLVIVLQMGMPPAFATLVLTEAFDLNRELTVTTLALGSGVILLTLPLWVTLFSL
jgi:malate permease and related proteins